jgi:3-methylcrotonyl-CoA carboxylase alpha subunit
VEAVAAALLHLGGYLAPVLDHSPFVVLRGFRLWGGEERSTTLMVGGRKVTASLTAADGRFLATCEGQSLGFRILSATEDALRLDFGDRVVKFTVTRDQETLSVTMAAERYEFLVPADETPEGSADGVGEIVSPVPGQLRDLLVKVGEVVERGRTVAILEAMKMEFSLKAERDGLVLAINAATGDQVAEGTVLIVIGDGNA